MSKSPRATFWTAQLTGWLGFALIQHLAYATSLDDPSLAVQLSAFAFKSCKAATGLLASLPLFVFYRAIWPRRLAPPVLAVVAVVGSLAAGALWFLLYKFVVLLVKPEAHFGSLVKETLSLGIVMLAWSAITGAVAYRREGEVARARALEANTLAARAELEMLRYQVHPHFLFNALNSLRALIDEDPARARRMVTELAELFRYALLAGRSGWSTLGEELAAVESYLAVQKVRFEDTLETRVDVPAVLADLEMPSFVVHPLVENAIKYGRETSPPPLVVEVTARRTGDLLVVEVTNSGRWIAADPHRNGNGRRGPNGGAPQSVVAIAPALRPDGVKSPRPSPLIDTPALPPGTGTGLDNLRRRLVHLYGPAARLTVGPRPEIDGGGVLARVEVPVRDGVLPADVTRTEEDE